MKVCPECKDWHLDPAECPVCFGEQGDYCELCKNKGIIENHYSCTQCGGTYHAVMVADVPKKENDMELSQAREEINAMIDRYRDRFKAADMCGAFNSTHSLRDEINLVLDKGAPKAPESEKLDPCEACGGKLILEAAHYARCPQCRDLTRVSGISSDCECPIRGFTVFHKSDCPHY